MERKQEPIEYHERCPKCGSTLITNGRVVWCTYVGGRDKRQEPGCDFRQTLRLEVESELLELDTNAPHVVVNVNLSPEAIESFRRFTDKFVKDIPSNWEHIPTRAELDRVVQDHMNQRDREARDALQSELESVFRRIADE